MKNLENVEMPSVSFHERGWEAFLLMGMKI